MAKQKEMHPNYRLCSHEKGTSTGRQAKEVALCLKVPDVQARGLQVPQSPWKCQASMVALKTETGFPEHAG